MSGMNKDGYISTADLIRILGISRQAIQKTLNGKEGIKIKQVGTGFLYEISSLPKEMKFRIKAAQTEAIEEMKEFVPDIEDIIHEEEHGSNN